MTYITEVLADAPLVWLRLGESSGTSAADSSGNGRTGTYSGSPTLGVAGALASNTAVTFDGTNDYVEVPATGLDVDASAQLTVEAWFKTSTVAKRQIVCRWSNSGGGSAQRWTLQIDAVGRPAFVLLDTGYRTINGSTSKADGFWHHLVVTAVGTGNGSLRMYLDGTQIVTGSRNATGLNGDTQALRVGATKDGAEWFNGSIDEVAVYATALSAARVAAHYAAGIGPIGTATGAYAYAGTAVGATTLTTVRILATGSTVKVSSAGSWTPVKVLI